MKLEFIDDLQSFIRYIAPGFTFLIGFGFAFPDVSEQVIAAYTPMLAFILAAFVGMAWYAIHRTLFFVIDYGIYYMLDSDVSETIDANMHPGAKESRGYFYARLANIHLSLVVFEQVVLLSFLPGTRLGAATRAIGLAFFVMSLISYIFSLSEIVNYDRKNRPKDTLYKPE